MYWSFRHFSFSLLEEWHLEINWSEVVKLVPKGREWDNCWPYKIVDKTKIDDITKLEGQPRNVKIISSWDINISQHLSYPTISTVVHLSIKRYYGRRFLHSPGDEVKLKDSTERVVERVLRVSGTPWDDTVGNGWNRQELCEDVSRNDLDVFSWIFWLYINLFCTIDILFTHVQAAKGVRHFLEQQD